MDVSNIIDYRDKNNLSTAVTICRFFMQNCNTNFKKHYQTVNINIRNFNINYLLCLIFIFN